MCMKTPGVYAVLWCILDITMGPTLSALITGHATLINTSVHVRTRENTCIRSCNHSHVSSCTTPVLTCSSWHCSDIAPLKISSHAELGVHSSHHNVWNLISNCALRSSMHLSVKFVGEGDPHFNLMSSFTVLYLYDYVVTGQYIRHSCIRNQTIHC